MRSPIVQVLPLVLSSGLFSIPASAEVPDELRTTPLASLFGAPATIGDPKLSPDGRQMIFLQQEASGIAALRLLDFEDASLASLLAGSDADAGYDIYWCAFANQTRVLCDLRQERSKSCASPAACWAYQIYVAIDSDGSNLLRMPAGTGCPDIDRMRDTHRIDWLPEDRNHILFSCRKETTLVDLYDGTEVHVDGVAAAAQVYTDGHGLLNMYWERRQQDDLWFVRDSIDSRWEMVHEASVSDFDDPFRPVGYGSDTKSLFHIAWNAATSTWGLYSRSLSDESEDALIFAHPALDVESINTAGPYERVVSVPYVDGRSRHHVIDERFAEVGEYVSGLLPDVDVEIIDESWDGNVYLARARIGNRAGEFIVIDMANDTIRSIAPEYEHLSGYELAESRVVRFDGGDGSLVSGLLTVPIDAATPAPAVIIPRGEAAHETLADPYYLAEFLAASGYAVLRVNVRGPDDLGGWLPSRSVVGRTRAAEDIRAAAGYLADAGIAEPGRVCAAGTDYGAYSALMAALEFPDLFSCIVGISAIVDPRNGDGAVMLAYGDPSIAAQARGESVAIVSAVAGELNDASPIRRADEMEASILLFQGHRDDYVDGDEHALAFARALEKEEKSFAFYEYERAYHSIDRGPYRTDMLARIAGFLAEHIGPVGRE